MPERIATYLRSTTSIVSIIGTVVILTGFFVRLSANDEVQDKSIDEHHIKIESVLSEQSISMQRQAVIQKDIDYMSDDIREIKMLVKEISEKVK